MALTGVELLLLSVACVLVFKLSEVDDWVRAGGANQARTRAKPVRRTTTRKTK